ncbi:MAG: sugar transferase [Frankiaceae bacterium]|nr:sugar transferase [Frankiaceae bacterium]
MTPGSRLPDGQPEWPPPFAYGRDASAQDTPLRRLHHPAWRSLPARRPAPRPTADRWRRIPRRAAVRWRRQYIGGLVLLDAGAIACAILIGMILRFQSFDEAPHTVSYPRVCLLLAAGWLWALQASGAYEVRHLTAGYEEFKRVARGSLLLAGCAAVVCYVGKLAVARGFIAMIVPLGIASLFASRLCARRLVRSRRTHGDWMYRIVAVGSRDGVNQLIQSTAAHRGAGLRVIGACLDDADMSTPLAAGVPVLGIAASAATIAEAAQADAVALAGSTMPPYRIRELGWSLEGAGRELIMAPGLTEVAGPRVHVSPVEGLPLMWVDQPQFTGMAQLAKRAIDVVGSVVILLLATPLLAVTALAIRLDTRGPVLFAQKRLGRNGEPFMVCKFRTMVDGAHAQRAELLDQNETDGHLFKIRDDPRITRVGKVLRQLSIDELPQLWNVLRGQMSLVGPRPLVAEDSNYHGSARRRLLVRPGMTGLWQVSGRSGLSWEDAVRLDLYYVENWSIGFDLIIIARTVRAVLHRHGAY